MLTLGACGSDKSDQRPEPPAQAPVVDAGPPKSPPAKETATVTTEELLTGLAARQMAGPSSVQTEASLAASGILPWGPAQKRHTVTIGSQQWVVNELASPDPFTHTYQLPSGSIVVSNEPLESIVTFTGDEGPEPPRVLWTSEYGDQWEVLPGRMEVYFDQTATETDIQQLIDAFNLNVVMSWFEPPDDSGMNSAIGGGGEVDRGASEAGKSASDGPLGLGNEIAWFDFGYDQQMLTTVEAAYQFFKGLPHVANCLPEITDYSQMHYPAPNDPYFTSTGNDRSLWISACDIAGYAGVPLMPYAGQQQYVAVMDSGVYRNHTDHGRLCSIGVECYDRSYWIITNGGNPNYPTDKDRWANLPYFHRLWGHGTQVASIINSATNNGIGVPSLAPGATVLPIRKKMWTKTFELPNVPDEPTFSLNTHVKAVRALRFEFNHGAYDFRIRVVNMSFGYPSYIRNLPWPDLAQGDFKVNLMRDLKKNDRL